MIDAAKFNSKLAAKAERADGDGSQVRARIQPAMILDAIHRIANHRESLSRQDARAVMSEVLAGGATDVADCRAAGGAAHERRDGG